MYAVLRSSGHRISGFEWFLVILAFTIDLGSYAGGRVQRARAAT